MFVIIPVAKTASDTALNMTGIVNPAVNAKVNS
jgi:hypothetical protein